MQDGDTSLTRASVHGYTAIVQYLVERTTAQVNVTNKVSHNVVVLLSVSGVVNWLNHGFNIQVQFLSHSISCSIR